ncbi:glycosyltransferase family 9 protein [Nitrospira moscoviensis]|uniref:Glycosyl transferase family 9 n=1 Tax=Nitrospira moscoviensis TaxID=42253 RepID=A0A0K2GF80_NITMO|nr:glycosyltransferase family 9 protein [Nitrospira moscoviensis]ALA59262.1 Glycosyl transferase family 9 [Nitrospira moscoviensis]
MRLVDRPHEPDLRKIAVLRANKIGDLIFSLPALDGLRRSYPRGEIVWLGTPLHAEFFGGRPSPVDRVVVVPPSRGVREEGPNDDPIALDHFFAAMQKERFDLAIQLHGGGRYSNPFVRRLGARLTVGLKTPDAAPLDRWVPYTYFQHEVIRYLEVMALVGAARADLEPRVAVTAKDRDEAERVSPSTTAPLVVIHPGASDPRRRWSPEKFAEVADRLMRDGATVAIIGTDADRPLADAVLAAMKSTALDLVGRLSLGGLIGLLSRARLIVANDSGPLHLAPTVGCASVGIYWCGNMINGGPLTRTRHRAAVSWQLDCSECGARCMEEGCAHPSSFVAGVPVAEVLEAALELLGAEGLAASKGGVTAQAVRP